MDNLRDLRKSYEKSELLENGLPTNPMSLFEKWFAEAVASGSVDEVNAMSLSTIGTDGFPKTRVVLLKEVASDGFIFFTNYNSEKGQSIAANDKVCLSFFWPAMERQIIIKGKAAKTSEQVSDDYFNSRPEGSRLGAIVSNQSSVISSREYLDTKLQQLVKEYSDKPISRPKHWGGFIVFPQEFEFWQGRTNRLHDRMKYIQNIGGWSMTRLSP